MASWIGEERFDDDAPDWFSSVVIVLAFVLLTLWALLWLG